MSQVVIIKLKKAGGRIGAFDISDDLGNVIATNVPKSKLIRGQSYIIDDNVSVIILKSVANCNRKCEVEVRVSITEMDIVQLSQIQYTTSNTASIWRHLTNPVLYNNFYGKIEPYIIEYPFTYSYQDEILQNVKDYTKAYRYFQNGDGVWNDNNKIEVDDQWFNKAVLYNGQQSTGVLELVPKPKHNLSEYMKYPIYGTESKTITFTKSDNFYQYNTF